MINMIDFNHHGLPVMHFEFDDGFLGSTVGASVVASEYSHAEKKSLYYLTVAAIEI